MKSRPTLCLIALTLFLILSFSSCTKNDTQPMDMKGRLLGSWTATPQNANYNQTIFFGEDSVTMHYVYFGTPNYASTFKGTFEVQDNKLNIKVTQAIQQEGNKAPTTTTLQQTPFDKATFRVDAIILTINFVTYPADGPVPTVQKFIKNKYCAVPRFYDLCSL